MSAISKTVKAFALIAALSAGSAMAGQGSCMPMAMPMPMPMPMMQGASGCGNSGVSQDSEQACQVREANASQDAGCNGQDLSSRMGSMAAGGMNIAMTVIGSIFGSPAR